MASPITGTGSRVNALYSEQQRGLDAIAVEENPFFAGVVPEGLLTDCEKKRRDTLVGGAVKKPSNLYRRVSAVNYRHFGDGAPVRLKHSKSKCFVCMVTLIKSGKDRQRAGVVLRCQCNVRVCTTCVSNNPSWYLTEPHYTECPTIREFVCTVCSCFERVTEKLCCSWMCSRCATEQGKGCSVCSKTWKKRRRRVKRELWHESKGFRVNAEAKRTAVENHNDKTAACRSVIKSRVFEKVAQSRHLSASDIRSMFHECFPPRPCTCQSDPDRNPLCTSCTPVLTIMRLLARNPGPLVASFAERAIPGRALARNVYGRALLTTMLNDRNLPLCANGPSCKGMLVDALDDPKPLTSLLTPELYQRFVRDWEQNKDNPIVEPCSCILCLLFNQSAAVSQLLSSSGIYLESHPAGPVYYFNVKLLPDVGVPEVRLDEYQTYLVNFQGSVGSYKPTFYYNWREMLTVLNRDESGKITISPVT